jgi:hypothetical protein
LPADSDSDVGSNDCDDSDSEPGVSSDDNFSKYAMSDDHKKLNKNK